MSHSEYKCKNCGATASSKCIAQRTVFPTNQTEAVLSNLLTREIIWKGNYTAEVRLYMHVGFNNHRSDTPDPPKSNKLALERALSLIRKVDDKTIKEWICDHNWQITEGECMFGCCVASEQE